MVDLRDQAA
jgi:hypothetical protein